MNTQLATASSAELAQVAGGVWVTGYEYVCEIHGGMCIGTGMNERCRSEYEVCYWEAFPYWVD